MTFLRRSTMASRFGPATERQCWVIRKVCPHLKESEIEALTLEQASDLIARHSENWRGYPPTYWQERFLRTWEQWRPGLTRGEASGLIEAIKERTAGMTPKEVAAERRWRMDVARGLQP